MWGRIIIKLELGIVNTRVFQGYLIECFVDFSTYLIEDQWYRR